MWQNNEIEYVNWSCSSCVPGWDYATTQASELRNKQFAGAIWEFRGVESLCGEEFRVDFFSLRKGRRLEFRGS